MLNNSKLQNRFFVAFLGGASLAALSFTAAGVSPALAASVVLTNDTADPIGSSNAGYTLNLNGFHYFLEPPLSSPATFAGVISGAGSVNIYGPETFTGINTYTAITDISAATLNLSGVGGIAQSAQVTNDGVFDISGTTSGASIVTLNSLGSGGTVILGSRTLTLTGANNTFAGVISGAGGLTVSGGTETLTNANTYTGLTSVSSGATLTLSGTGAIASVSSLTTNGIFNFSAATNGVSVMGLSGSGSVVLGSKPLTIHDATSTFSGVISGTGSLTISGPTTAAYQTLSGVNTYTGGTTIGSASTLTISSGGAVGGGAVTNAGTLSLSSSQSITSYTQSAGSLIFNASSDTAYGSLTVSGAASMANDAIIFNSIGGYTPTGGTQFILVNAASGNFTGDTLTYDMNGTTGALSTLTAGNGKQLILTISAAAFKPTNILASHTYSADNIGTTVNPAFQGGTLQAITSKNLQTAFTLDSSNTNTIDQHGIAIGFSGVISDAVAKVPGNIIIANSGVDGGVFLGGANTYTGTTTINSGAALYLSGAGSISSSPILDNGMLDLTLSSQDGSGSIITSLSGSGVVNLGTNTLTTKISGGNFTGSFTGTGGLNIAGGLQKIKDFSGKISVQNNASLEIDGLATGGLTISTDGDVLNYGTVGVVTVTGNGRFDLRGGNAGAVTLASPGAIFIGYGTVSSLTLSPSSEVDLTDRLNVLGDLNMNNGYLVIDTLEGNPFPEIFVNGTAHVSGTVVFDFSSNLDPDGAHATKSGEWTIIDPPGGVTGTFSSLETHGLPPYLTANLSYDANNVYLNLVTVNLEPQLPAGSPTNLTNTATAIDAAVTAGGIPSTGMLALYSQTGATLAGSITQAEGQVGANVATAVTQSFAPFLKTMSDQCATGSDQDASTSCVWSSVYGGHTGIAANVTTGAASLSGSNVGLAVGGQMNVAEIDAVLGASLAYGQQTFSSGNGTGTSRDILLGIYAHKTIMDRGYISASLGYGNLDVTTTRNITVSGTDVLSGKVNAHEFGGHVEGGYHLAVDDQYGLTPYLAGSLQNIVTPAYAEGVQSGTSSFAVSYLSQNNTLGRIEAGTHIDRSFQLDDETNLTAQGTIGWSHQLGFSPVSTVSFQSLSGSSFLLNGIRPANDTAVLGLNLQAHKTTGLSFGVRLDSQVGSGTTIIEAAGNVAYRW